MSRRTPYSRSQAVSAVSERVIKRTLLPRSNPRPLARSKRKQHHYAGLALALTCLAIVWSKLIAAPTVQSPVAINPFVPDSRTVPRQKTRKRRFALPSTSWFILGVAWLIATAWFTYYYSHDMTLLYSDGVVKLLKGRQVWDNATSSFHPSGLYSIWLWGPSSLISLTAWYTPLYITGISGSVWSILAFGITVREVYLIVYIWKGRRLGAFAAAIIAGTNLSLIYFAGTPMAESLIVASLCMTTRCLLKYEQTGEEKWLTRAALVLMVSCTMRYELWWQLFVAVPLVFLVRVWVRSGNYRQFLPDSLPLVWLAGLVVGGCLIFQRVIYGDFLHFSHSEYSARAIDVIGANKRYAVHNLGEASWQYRGAVEMNVPQPILLLMLVGLAFFTIRVILRKETLVSPIYLWGIPCFFVFSLFMGQNAIDIREVGHRNSFNIRYGIISLPLVAVFAGYAIDTAAVVASKLFSWFPGARVLGVGVGLLVLCCIAKPSVAQWQTPQSIGALEDVGTVPNKPLEQLIQQFRDSWDYGQILTYAFGNNSLIQVKTADRIPTKAFITESDPTLFSVMLEELTCDWVIVRTGDRLDQELVPTPEFQANFVERISTPYGRVYVARDH